MSDKQVYVFIGPPKTATTSLQHWLMEHNGEGYTYLGCMQPRSKFQKNDFSFKLYKTLSKTEIDPIEANLLLKQLEKYDQANLPIIISEESFLHTPNWPIKVRNLYRFFAEWKLSIVIGHRNADSAIPSYFAETYGYLPSRLRNNYQAFLESNWINQYNFRHLYATLLSAGFNVEQILWFDFKKLTTSKLSLNQILLSHCNLEIWKEPIILPNENRKSKDNEAKVSDVKSYVVRINKLKAKSKRFKRIYKKADIILFGFLSSTNILGFKQIKTIQIPSSEALNELNQNNVSFLKSID